ncbi:hypothetical protein SAMN05660964_00495 [Thiothrix caldifontis]|uniref:Uncharacterized protein n=1 Tax=Thiothrix caldifontis TaxID=525918 RepID=A0A1H3WL45_9GAMM|nr:hypothetical protein [Thiothrix caldifontis]SDZ87867.1 hypothetical protein SAMN05660964_00495 [Thiothrix caldifontis]
MQSCRVPMTFLLALLSGVTVAHDGIMHHPETHSELTHFAAHLWMAVPVAVGAALLVWGAKRYLAKRTDPSKRD